MWPCFKKASQMNTFECCSYTLYIVHLFWRYQIEMNIFNTCWKYFQFGPPFGDLDLKLCRCRILCYQFCSRIFKKLIINLDMLYSVKTNLFLSFQTLIPEDATFLHVVCCISGTAANVLLLSLEQTLVPQVCKIQLSGLFPK